MDPYWMPKKVKLKYSYFLLWELRCVQAFAFWYRTHSMCSLVSYSRSLFGTSLTSAYWSFSSWISDQVSKMRIYVSSKLFKFEMKYFYKFERLKLRTYSPPGLVCLCSHKLIRWSDHAHIWSVWDCFLVNHRYVMI